MNDFLDDNLEPEPKSKSQLKQEMAELQEIGAEIVKLSEADLNTIPLEGDLEFAILEARRIKSREGLRRQMQYIGKLMRKVDNEPIMEALQAIRDKGLINLKLEKTCERWRDRILSEGNNALQPFFEEHPHADFQLIRQLTRNAQNEAKNNKPPAAARKLFKTLRETLKANQ